MQIFQMIHKYILKILPCFFPNLTFYIAWWAFYHHSILLPLEIIFLVEKLHYWKHFKLFRLFIESSLYSKNIAYFLCCHDILWKENSILYHHNSNLDWNAQKNQRDERDFEGAKSIRPRDANLCCRRDGRS